MTDVEKVARAIAPHMQGGREFDQCPPDRIALRKWSREGMCSVGDATQAEAMEAAQAALSAIDPVALVQAGIDAAAEACERHMANCLDDKDVQRRWPTILARNGIYCDAIRALSAADVYERMK